MNGYWVGHCEDGIFLAAPPYEIYDILCLVVPIMISLIEWMPDSCLAPTQKFVFIMARTS